MGLTIVGYGDKPWIAWDWDPDQWAAFERVVKERAAGAGLPPEKYAEAVAIEIAKVGQPPEDANYSAVLLWGLLMRDHPQTPGRLHEYAPAWDFAFRLDMTDRVPGVILVAATKADA